MSRMLLRSFGVLVVLGTLPHLAAAQSARTHTTGLLLGYGVEENVVSTRPGASSASNQHVGGRGVTLGYGFTRNWTSYANVGWGDFLTSGGNRTSVGSADLGVRYHLPVVGRVAVPFLQGGVSSRTFSADAVDFRTGQPFSAASGRTLPAFGGGANVHVSPSVAVSGMSTWSASRQGLASPRLHLGVLFTPGALGR